MSVPVTFRIGEAEKAELDRVAKELDRPPSAIVARALSAYLAHRRERIADLREAVQEADKGVFISSQSIHRWLESLDTDAPLPFPEPDILPDA